MGYVLAPSFADLFTNVSIKRGGFVLDRRTGRYSQQVTLTNNGSMAIAGPQALVLDSLSSNTSLVNATGVTANNAPTGSPFLSASGDLAPGASVTVSLLFSKPTSGAITYSARTVSGAANP